MRNVSKVGFETVIHPALTIKCEDCGSAVGDECTKGRRDSPVRTLKPVPCSWRKLAAEKAGAVLTADQKARVSRSDAVRDAHRAGRYAPPPPSLPVDAETLALLQARGMSVEEFAARKAKAVRRISLRQTP
jgi:hypothetical protein